MAMYIVGTFKGVPFNPDACFDPVTHVATEAAFIQLLQHGVYDSKYIGYKVQLGNSVDYNNGLWVIADVNHDSANTGQTNCYDLISQDCFYSVKFGNNQNWRSSTPRTWLNNTFYPGFSTEFKNHILNPKYNSQGTWYTDDYVTLPSYKEVNGGTSSYQDNEGVAYPIFTNSTSRIKKYNGSAQYWWTRSRYTNDGGNVWYVSSGGSMLNTHYAYSYYLAPLMRVH
jgi:hypothetical protein